MAACVLFQQITECLNGPEEIPSLFMPSGVFFAPV
jgi:hypothetical protein